MLHRAARNAYSWWWASHVRTKQSKWLDQNLQDMEEKVEYILKIIEEEADTFRQRAEMYYRKRPELVNFVEDSFRGYRALAERYDHLSRELQNANRTIASVLPESVHLPMDDDDFDGENLPATAMRFSEFNDLPRNLPPAPKISIPKDPSLLKKNGKGKMPSRLMSRKGLVKTNAGDSAVSLTVSGLNKSEALQKIDKLQKEILALQTEKEFVKSSYECGLEKYWNIEKQITEMQAEVSNLQDGFGIGTVIEDDEARTLMTATALKSCQEALTQLQQKQEQSVEETRAELQKIQEAREKFKRLKEKFDTNQAHQEVHSEKAMTISHNMEANRRDEEVDCAEQNIHDVESLRKRIKQELQLKLGSSLTMTELAEKVDELVEKIINLESAVSSQSAHVKSLKSETNELQTHLQSLEEEKESLIEDSHSMSSKIRDLEEELQRVQSLNQCIEEQNNHLQARYIEASCSVDDLSEKLLDVKPDEVQENFTLLGKDTDVPGVSPIKQIKQTRSSVHHPGVPPDSEVKSTSDFNSGIEVQENSSCSSVFSQGKVMSDDIKGHNNSIGAEPNNDLLPNQCHNESISQSGSSLNVNSEEWFGEAKDRMGHGYGSMIMYDTDLHQEAKKQNLEVSSTCGVAKKESFLDEQNNIEDFLTAQEKATPDANLLKEASNVNPSGYHIETPENVRTGCKGLKDGVLGDTGSYICENGKIYFNQGEHHYNHQTIEVPIEDGLSNSLERRLEEEANVTAPYHNLLEGHMKVESNVNDSILSNWENQISGYSLTCEVGDLQDAKLEKSDIGGHKAVPGQDMVMKGEIFCHSNIQSASENHSRSFVRENCGYHSFISACDDNGATEDEKIDSSAHLSPDKLFNSGESVTNNQFNDLPMNNQVKSISGTTQLKEIIANDEMTSHDIPTATRESVIAENGKTNSLPGDQAKDQEAKLQHVYQTLEYDLTRDLDELSLGDDDQPNWKELFLSGLDDKEKLLLQEYTSILRTYKEARKKLNEVEKNKRASLFQYCIQIKVLKSANASKDAKIESLEKKLNLLQENQDETVDSKETRNSGRFHVSDGQSLLGGQKELPDMLQDPASDSIAATERSPAQEQLKHSFREENGGIKIANIDEPQNLTVIEERIRTDIDELLDENIGFWMKFSTSFHQVQKFQTTVQDLQSELAKVKKNKKHNGNTNPQSLISDIRPIYRHLSEIQTELTLWLDKTAMLKDDLDNRLSSLSSIQEEITRLSNAGSRIEETELSDYQAAKFHGEVLNMKQENQKVAHELQLGLERVKVILVEIERTLRGLDAEFGVSARKQQPRNSPVRSKIPLRTFLFGVKLKKQKPSFFACISPSLQKQYSDLAALPI